MDIGIILWLAFYNCFGNVGQYEDTVLVISLDSNLYKSVLCIPFDKVCDRCSTRQNIIGKHRLQPFDLGRFSCKKCLAEKNRLQDTLPIPT